MSLNRKADTADSRSDQEPARVDDTRSSGSPSASEVGPFR